ncbi:MAG TPA: metallophosphoesterase [Phycisphaerae bacterium]|nr:metallophosphoesterase [Phycisphaerae bacterium]
MESATQSPPIKRRSSLRIIIALAALAAIGALIAERKTRPTLTYGPMVQIPEPGALTIVWGMDAVFPGGSVWLRTAPDQTLTGSGRCANGRCEVSFKGLEPGRAYPYEIANDRLIFGSTKLAGPYEAKPALPRGRPFRFAAFGDSGNGSNTQTEFARRIAASKPDVIIHVGDLVYPAGALDTYDTHFFGPNAEMIRTAPFMASLGNHDVATEKGAPLLEVFVAPRNGPEGIEPERNYWFDYGDARFVALDSNLEQEAGAITKEQMKNIVAPWLRRVLTETDAKWKFVFFHHVFYTGSTHPPEGGAHMKEAFLSVFEECGVDVVFCGHNHLYERTAPLRGDQVVPDGKGIVYITTGCGGVSRYAEIQPPPKYMRAYNHEVFSFTQVDLSATRFEMKQIDENGKVIDEYTINKPEAQVAN